MEFKNVMFVILRVIGVLYRGFKNEKKLGV
jgi:hypothetical protein